MTSRKSLDKQAKYMIQISHHSVYWGKFNNLTLAIFGMHYGRTLKLLMRFLVNLAFVILVIINFFAIFSCLTSCKR